MLLLHQSSEIKTVSFLSNEFCEEQAFPYFLPKGKFGYNAPPDIPVSPAWYFNQHLLNLVLCVGCRLYLFCLVCV